MASYLHNGILRSREKEEPYTLCHSMDAPPILPQSSVHLSSKKDPYLKSLSSKVTGTMAELKISSWETQHSFSLKTIFSTCTFFLYNCQESIPKFLIFYSVE